MKFINKNLPIILTATIILAFTVKKTEVQFAPVAIIELFTSQGCSSCPSAEKLMTKTLAEAKKNGQHVLALSFHVDYWNRLGWKDPFSDKKYSERQQNYAQQFGLGSVYTPQAIVNGQQEMVGSDEQKINTAVNTYLKEKADAEFKSISLIRQTDHSIKVDFTLAGNYQGADVNVALVSLYETTTVKRGENSGATLTNENVVRQFISARAAAAGNVIFTASPIPSETNTAVVAYIQRRSDGKIIGAQMSDKF